MPTLLVLLGMIAAACVWVTRKRKAAEMTHELTNAADDVIGAARRLGFGHNGSFHPVDSIDDTALGIGALAQAFLELGSLPTGEQQNALIGSLQTHLGKNTGQAEATLVLGRWLISQCNGAEPAIERLARRLAKLDRAGSFDRLMAVLSDVARAQQNGQLSDKQVDALTEIARIFNVA